MVFTDVMSEGDIYHFKLWLVSAGVNISPSERTSFVCF